LRTTFEELDLSKIDVDQYPEGTVSDCGIPSYFFGLTFVYNTETYKDNAPTKLSDFFDLEQFPGTRVLSPEFGNGIMEYALMADGIEPDLLYPLDIERALAKLDTIKLRSSLRYLMTFCSRPWLMGTRIWAWPLPDAPSVPPPLAHPLPQSGIRRS
jgi:spermidine/putrescine-binding protein